MCAPTEDAVNLIKSHKTRCYFSLAPFLSKSFFFLWFRCFVSRSHRMAHMCRLIQAQPFSKAKRNNGTFFFFNNEINVTHARTHTSAKRLNQIVAWTIKILSGDSLKRLPRISLLNYYCSSILAFIVDLPTDFLVDSIVILCNDFLLPTSFFPLTPCCLPHFFFYFVQQSMKSRTTDIFSGIFQNKLFTFWMEWKPDHRLNQPLIYLHKSRMQECI